MFQCYSLDSAHRLFLPRPAPPHVDKSVLYVWFLLLFNSFDLKIKLCCEVNAEKKYKNFENDNALFPHYWPLS